MRASVFCILLVVGSHQLHAQETELRPGAKVRISAPGIVADRFVGTVLTRTTEAVVVGGPEIAPVSIPLARITMLELSHGKNRARGAIEGLTWGVGIGAGLGLATMGDLTQCSGGTTNCHESAGSDERRAYVGLLAFSGIFYGSVIGALIGKEEWDRFDFIPRAALEMRDGRPGLSVSIRM